MFIERSILGAGWEHREEMAIIVQEREVRGEAGNTRGPRERSGGI